MPVFQVLMLAIMFLALFVEIKTGGMGRTICKRIGRTL